MNPIEGPGSPKSPPTPGLRHTAAHGVFWSMGNQFASQLITTSIFIVLARLLTPSDFGVVALASVYLIFVEIFVDQGLGMSLIQRHEVDREHMDAAFWVNLASGAALCLVTIVLAPFVSRAFGEPRLGPVLSVLSVALVLAALRAVPDSLLTRDFRFRALAVRTISANIVSGLVGVGMALKGFGVWSLVVQQLTHGAVSAAVLWTACDWRPRMQFSRGAARDIMGFGMRLGAGRLLYFTNKRIPPLLIGATLGTAAVGIFSIAEKLVDVAYRLAVQTVQQIALPVFSRLQREPERLLAAYYDAIRLTSFLTFPVFIALATLSEEFVAVCFDPRWAPAAPAMRFLAVVALVNSAGVINAAVVTGLGHSGMALKFGITRSVVANVALLFVVSYGITAAAATLALSAALTIPFGRKTLKSVLPMDEMKYARSFMAPLASSALMSGAMLLVKISVLHRLPAYQRLSLELSAGFIVYMVTTARVSPGILQEFVRMARAIVTREKPA